MSGCSGAISAIVRAIASAVRGSLEGLLTMASPRVIALRTIVIAPMIGLLPAMTWTVRAPNARTAAPPMSHQPSRKRTPIERSAASMTASGARYAGSWR